MVDLASREQLAVAKTWLAELWPAKRWILEAPHGELPLSRLMGQGETASVGVVGDSDAHRRLREAASGALEVIGEAGSLPDAEALEESLDACRLLSPSTDYSSPSID
ncbi:hypothetical protein ACR80S_10930 [Halomonas sp. MA07-2]|uniref:hypothetical protein n=1 Tax=Halomonas sp. MA07-2 TaxID=3440841 RepID=UPI003EEAA1BC